MMFPHRGARTVVALGALLSCRSASEFLCGGDDDCSLAGTPGVCIASHCAYPDSECPSGLRYPVGAPPELAQTCADGPSAGTGPGSTGAGSDTGSVASSGAVDGTTAAVGSSDGAGSSSSGPAGTTTGSIPSCDARPLQLSFEAIADAYFSNADACGEEGVAACGSLNFGATPVYSVFAADGAEALMVVRFDFDEPGPTPVTVTDARLVVSAIVTNPGPVMTEGRLDVYPLANIPWVEGSGNGTLAAEGESNWEAYDVPDLVWGNAGPVGQVSGRLLGASDALEPGPDPIAVSIDLSPEGVGEWLFSGGDSVVLRGPVTLNGALFVLSRESARALPVALELSVCLR
ncbi:MAG: hypothetical protein AAF721_04455 [Myxococcota bacterium]